MLRNASAELPRTANPQLFKFAARVGITDGLQHLGFRRAMMCFGVPAGARIADHELKKKPGRPDSETVGTPGNCAVAAWVAPL